MAKTKFGDFKPKHLGAEPADVVATPDHEGGPDDRDLSVSALYSLKVPYSSRITVSAQRQLARLGRKGHTQVDLLAEALNLLSKSMGLRKSLRWMYVCKHVGNEIVERTTPRERPDRQVLTVIVFP